MRQVEIRRHSLTKKGEGRGRGSHLSAEGVMLARRVGRTTGPFDRVTTSTVPRTLETALAMGFAVDDCVETVGDIDAPVLAEVGHHDRWHWSEPFTVFVQLVQRGGATARLGQTQAETWAALAASLPEEGAALVVSHGRVIEAGAVTCFPSAAHAGWGLPFRHCEGIRLCWEGGAFTGFELLRVSNE